MEVLTAYMRLEVVITLEAVYLIVDLIEIFYLFGLIFQLNQPKNLLVYIAIYIWKSVYYKFI